MGLRINFNSGFLTAIRNLQQNSARQTNILERLSTAQRVNRASDDPAAFVAISALTGQINATNRAVENIETAVNLFNTAEVGLSQVSELLEGLSGNVVRAMNEGALPLESRQILQSQIDTAVNAINRLSGNSRFAGQNLLNGALAFEIQNVSPQLTRVNVTEANPGENGLDVDVNVTSAATRAQAQGTIAATQTASATVRIQGPSGQAEINIQAGATRAQIVEQINSFEEQTGVEATSSGEIRSVNYGSDSLVRVENVQGQIDGISSGLTKGTDVQAVVNGEQVTGQANTITVNSANLRAQIDVQAGQTGNFSFRVTGGGARIQTGTESTDSTTIGINSTLGAFLGSSSGLGNLESITTGRANNVLDNPANALAIIQAAQTEVSTQRSHLGASVGSLFEPLARVSQANATSLSAAKSTIGDADFAVEAASLLRSRILAESGIRTLRSQNLNSGAILNLLA